MAEDNEMTLEEAVAQEVMEKFSELSEIEFGTPEYTQGVKAFKELTELGRFDDKVNLDEDVRRQELILRRMEIDARLETLALERDKLSFEMFKEKRAFWLEIGKLGVKVLVVVIGGAVYIWTAKLGFNAEESDILFSRNTAKIVSDVGRYAVDTMKGR